MSTELIVIEKRDRILTLRFNRPDKKNALTQAMYTALATALESAAGDTQVRVALIAGQPDCFTSGNDMVDFMKAQPKDWESSAVARFMRALANFQKPIIAAPSGIAVGIGVTLLLHCDLVYCGSDTRLSMPFSSIGICPEYASTYLLPRLMGHVRTCELVLLGEPFSAQKALEYGLVNQLTPNTEVEALARAKALQIALLPPNATRVTKALLKRWRADVVAQAVPLEAAEFGPMLTKPEAMEAMSAFMQKRKPDFSRFN